MGMVVDVILAIAIIAIAAGTIPEFQIRIGNIGSAANGAAVGIGGCVLVGFGEDYYLRTCWLLSFSGSVSSQLDPPC